MRAPGSTKVVAIIVAPEGLCAARPKYLQRGWSRRRRAEKTESQGFGVGGDERKREEEPGSQFGY